MYVCHYCFILSHFLSDLLHKQSSSKSLVKKVAHSTQVVTTRTIFSHKNQLYLKLPAEGLKVEVESNSAVKAIPITKLIFSQGFLLV